MQKLLSMLAGAEGVRRWQNPRSR